MNEYHKIQTVFKRDMENNGKTLLEGQWTKPEFWYLANNEWTFTEKVDGTNIRVMWDGSTVKFAGKTDNAQISAKLIDRLRERFSAELFISAVGESNVCLYGEGYGAGIQKGGTYRQDQDFVLFDVKIGDWWLTRPNVQDVASKLSVDIVPIIGSGTLYNCIEIVRDGMKSTWGDFIAEGIVARPAVEMFARGGERIITKIKHKDFSK